MQGLRYALLLPVRWALLLASTAVVALACGPADDAGSSLAEGEDPGSTLYRGGDILTMEGDDPTYVEAVVAEDGMIAYVGSLAGAQDAYGPFTREVDLTGRTLLPGFIDPHGHVSNVGVQALSANLLPAPDGRGNSFDELVEVTRAWMASEEGQYFIERTGWVIGFGYDDSQLAEQVHPPSEVLDRVTTEYPVYFIHQSGHLGAMNGRAIEAVGYTADTEDPPGGVIRRRADGSPDGVLEENAHFAALFEALGTMSEEVKDRAVQRGQELYASFGYTTAQDGRAMLPDTEALARAAARGDLIIDVVAYADIVQNRSATDSPHFGPDYMDRYRIGGLKLNLDGSPQGKTAWLTECYFVNPPGQEGCYSGYPTMPDEEAEAYVADALGNGIQILAHVNGDAAIDQFVRAVRKANQEFGPGDRRPVAIHSQTIREDQLDAYLQEGIVPALFPMHTFYWGDWHASSVLGPERAARISPAATAREKGLIFTTHHDAPVALPSSIRVLDATVNRTSRSGAVIGPDERVDPYTALRAMTVWPAYQHFEEDRKGTLAVGKAADFVILDRNPLEIPTDELDELEVVQTISRGRTVYSR